jgi:hypothetical protein
MQGSTWRERLAHFLLAGLFPFLLIGAIVALGLILQFHAGRPTAPPPTIAAQLLGLSIVAGIFSMAAVQMVKSLLGIRGVYQQRQIREWFKDRDRSSDDNGYNEFLSALDSTLQVSRGVESPESMSLQDQRRLQRQSNRLVRDKLRYLFDLPIEQVCAQVSNAADIAFASPENYQEFLICLAGEPIFRRFSHVREAVAASSPQAIRIPSPEAATTPSPEAATTPSPEAVNEARMELSHYVRSGIDQLQVSVGHRWRTYVRATAVWVSGLIGLAIVGLSSTASRELATTPSRERGLYILTSVIAGGFLSWFTRDLVAIVERLRA